MRGYLNLLKRQIHKSRPETLSIPLAYSVVTLRMTATLALFLSIGVAQAKAQECPSQNSVIKTCSDLLHYIDQPGVLDVDNKPHPTKSGWTQYKTTYDYEIVDEKFSKERRGTRPGESLTCYKAKVMATFTVNTKICSIDWTPKPGSSPLGWEDLCQRVEREFEQKVNAHEVKHQNDIVSVVMQANRKWSTPRDFKVCGSSPLDAQKNLKERVEKELDKQLKWINQEANKRAEAFHATPEGQNVELNCSLCEPSACEPLDGEHFLAACESDALLCCTRQRVRLPDDSGWEYRYPRCCPGPTCFIPFQDSLGRVYSCPSSNLHSQPAPAICESR